MASSFFRPSTRRTVILTDSDDGGVQKDTDIQSYIEQIKSLKAQVTRLQTEVLDLKANLEHLQVDLKYANEKLKNAIDANNQSEPKAAAHISNSRTISKRPRSPSIEFDDPQVWKKKKAEKKEERIVVKPPVSPRKPKLEVYVSVPRIESLPSRLKIEKESPKKLDLFSYGSNSLSRSDNRHVPRQPRRDSVDRAVSPGSQLDSNVTRSAPSGITTPDIYPNRDQMAASTSSAGPANTQAAQVMTQTVHKANDSKSQVAPVLRPPAGLVINPAPSIVTVPRALLLARYGGQARTLIQKINEQHNPSSTGHTTRQLIFPDFEHNPDLPLKPGASGFIFASRKDVQGHSFSLFVRCTKSKKRVWKYFGEYRTERCGTMSTQYFRSLSDKVQNAWATSILEASSEPTKEYIAMRVRIKLRQSGAMPLEDQVIALVQEEMMKKKKKKPEKEKEKEGPKLKRERKKKTPEEVKEQTDILEAMLRGEEHLGIVKLTCTSYDLVFAEDIRQTATKSGLGETIENFIHPKSTGSLNLKSLAKSKNSKAATSRRGAFEESSEDDDQSSTGVLDDASVHREEKLQGIATARVLRSRKLKSPALSDAEYEELDFSSDFYA